MADVDKLVTFKPRAYPQQSDGQPNYLTGAFKGVSDSIGKLIDVANQSDAAAIALTTRVTTVEGRATVLEGRATTDEAAITTLQGRATTDEAAITALQSRATSDETDIAARALKGSNSDITALTACVVTDEETLHIEFPNAKDYYFSEKLAHALTIIETTTHCRVGTATVTPKINTTAIGGAAHSATTSQNSITRSTSNAAVATDAVLATVSSPSTDCEDLRVTFKFTRAIS